MVVKFPVFPNPDLAPANREDMLRVLVYSQSELAERVSPERDMIHFVRGGHVEDGSIVGGTATSHSIFGYEGSLESELASDVITREKAMHMLESMLMGRELEKMSVHLKYKEFGSQYGELTAANFTDLSFPTHLAIGQEAMSVGTIFALDPKDYITSTHRGHVDALVKGHRAILAMSADSLDELLNENKDIRRRLGYDLNPHGRENKLKQAIEVHIYRTIAELFGKKDGYCGGEGGGMHLAWCKANNLGNNAVVAGMAGIGVGSGMASRMMEDGRTTAMIAGDGAFINENTYGAVSMATMGQLRNGLMTSTRGPSTVLVCTNNQYAMTCQMPDEVTSNRYLLERFVGWNQEGLHGEVAFGMDTAAVHDSIRRAKQQIDAGLGPVYRELWGYRFFGHSLSDDALDFSGKGGETYRTADEILRWKNYDPVSLFASQMIHAGLITETQFRRLEASIEEKTQRLSLAAYKSDFPSHSTMLDHLYTGTTSEVVPAKFQNPKSPGPRITFAKTAKTAYCDGVKDGLAMEMRRDLRVSLAGEDLAEYGGAFGDGKGLLGEFGRDRVHNTPLCEANITGTAIGMALRGLRPIVKSSMYIDFVTQALDQIANHAAKLPYMSGGQLMVPAVFWTDMGGGMSYAGQHSQQLEAMLAMFPGLKVVAPATPYDAKGLMIAAIRDDNPIVFIGHQNLFKSIRCYDNLPEPFASVPDEYYTVPIGVANVIRQAPDEIESGMGITMVSYSWMLHHTLKAADMLAQEGYHPEVIDLRTLLPLPMGQIYESVAKTGNLLIAHQACKENGLGEVIAGRFISTETDEEYVATRIVNGKPMSVGSHYPIDLLDSHVQIVGAPFCIPPCSMPHEKSFDNPDGSRNVGFIPGDKEIYAAAKEILAAR